MKLNATLFLFVLIVHSTVFSQFKSTDVLLTIDGEEVHTKEFYKVFNKNLEMVQDESQKDMNSYLELFISYKLKAKEAHAQGLHKNPTYISEFSGYREQLAQNYLYDQEITEELIEEAYARLQEEIHANHILIMVDEDARPEDTITAYNKIKEIRQKAISGDDFEDLARKFSEEPQANERAGDLGYFKGFGMVYEFENAAYNTAVGQVSDIIRTKFGYHILKVNDRRRVPEEVTVAHIMIAPNEEVTEAEAETRINEILQRVKQGEDFGALARQFSNDLGSAKNNGVMARFGSGRLNAPNFEQAAFALKNPGDISEPIKTEFGWHIIKLKERHPRLTLEQSREEILKKIKGTERSRVIMESISQKIKDKYGFSKNDKGLSFFNNFVTDSVLTRTWSYDKNYAQLGTTLFSIADKKYTYGDFAAYIADQQKRSRAFTNREVLVQTYYNQFEDEKIKDYFMVSLENENEDYASLIAEYRNGLLIYDLMQKNIWETARKDTLGLQSYFNNNKDNYKWKPRVRAEVASTSSEKTANQVQEMFRQGKSPEEIREELNKNGIVKVTLTSGVFETDHQSLPSQFEPVKGISRVYGHSLDENTNTGQYIVVHVKEVLAAAPKKFEEVKGRIISDYQAHLEEEWMKQLRKKYTVKVNKKALKHL